MFSHIIISFLNAAIPMQGVSKIVQKVSNAIVEIGLSSDLLEEQGINDEFLKDFFGEEIDIEKDKNLILSNGSGVIINENGLVVTLADCIKYCIKSRNANVKIRLKTRAEYDATVKYIDEKNNLAFLQILMPNKKLPFLKIGNSDTVFHGDFIVSIGNTHGLGQSVVGGIISMPTRVFNNNVFLQTDTSVSHGTQGGAVIDINGNLIGLNYLQKPTSYGIGFAIPSNLIKAIKEKSNGRKPATFELDVENISYRLRESGIHHGVQVQAINNNQSPFKFGDIITKINDISVNSREEFFYREQLSAAGESIKFRVFRDGKYSNITIKAKEDMESSQQNTFSQRYNSFSNESFHKKEISADPNSLLKNMQVLEVSSGLKILEEPSRCNVILKKDDIICELNDKRNKTDLISILKSSDNSQALNLSIKRDGKKIQYKIQKLRKGSFFKESIFAEVIEDGKTELKIVDPDIELFNDLKKNDFSFEQGDIILEISNKKTDLLDIIKNLNSDGKFSFKIKRNDNYYDITLEHNNKKRKKHFR